MGRLVVVIVLVVLAAWLVRRAWRASKSSVSSRSAGPAQQDLVSCARCGMHLPRSEAREAGGQLYCGEEHARLGAGGP
ncbi:MAG TPA: PP0621 family protein [Burkholderiales bacterium]|nr:PP0621 family protein [Burkholderiales bacterium]